MLRHAVDRQADGHPELSANLGLGLALLRGYTGHNGEANGTEYENEMETGIIGFVGAIY